MRAIPIGVDDFREIMEADGYYVDKTALIDHLLKDKLTKVHQFVRPRRFGKSTNLSMLDYYFNMRYAGNDWFDGLEISDLRPDDPEKNAHPVISLSLKDAYTSTYEEFEISMGIRMSDIYLKFPEIAECGSVPASLRKRYEDVIERRAAAPLLKNALGDLSDDDLRVVAADALEQIRKMDYTHGLRGKTLMYGIAFSGKRPAIASDIVEM